MPTERLVRTLVVSAVVIWLVAGGYVLLRGGPRLGEELGIVVLVGTFAGLLSAGIHYLVLHALEIRNLRFPADELRDGEQVLRQSPGSIAHYSGGSSLRTWEAVGGRLFLTDQRVVFVTFRMQLRCYRLATDLSDVRKVEAGAGLKPGELRLTTAQTRELFTFGVFRHLEAEEWAAAILLARYRAHPDREWPEGA